MANVYTELAKKRTEQSQTPVNAPLVSVRESTPPPLTPSQSDVAGERVSSDTPLPSPRRARKIPVTKEKKRKIGAYFTTSQRQILDVYGPARDGKTVVSC